MAKVTLTKCDLCGEVLPQGEVDGWHISADVTALKIPACPWSDRWEGEFHLKPCGDAVYIPDMCRACFIGLLRQAIVNTEGLA